jgi:hypothetical protein
LSNCKFTIFTKTAIYLLPFRLKTAHIRSDLANSILEIMSNLLLEWLNNDVGLSVEVFQFGESFRNGYLLGEILARYNQQEDFSRFVDKEAPMASLNNFQRLEPTMKKIGVKFDSRTVADIMAANDKVVKTLLYEMKASLERLARNSTMSIPPKLRGTKHDRVLNVVQNTRPAFDQTKSLSFQRVVRGSLENTNQVLMNELTKKYTNREETYFKTISTGESTDWDQMGIERKRERDIYRSRKQNESEFKQVFNTINEQQWVKNQKTAHKRKELTQKVENDLQRRYQEKTLKVRDEHRDYTLHSMDHFEKRLDEMILPIGDENNEEQLKNSFIRTYELKSAK